MRCGWLFILVLICAGAWAQDIDILPSETVKSSARSFFERSGVIKRKPDVPDPGVGGVLPPRDPNLPDAFEVVSADNVKLEGDDIEAVGNVEILYQGYRLQAQRIFGNRKTQVFELTGGATLTGNGEKVEGESVDVDFKSKLYKFSEGKAVITPDRTQGQTSGNFFTSAGSGTLNERHYHIAEGTLTSCELAHPHYKFELKSGDLDPGKRLILRDVKFDVLGRTVLKLPYLYIPLLDDRPRYLPEFGQSQDEGYFVKSRYVTPLKGEDTFETRLDLMSKLGVGLGGDWRYLTKNSEGGLGVYSLTGSSRTLVANWLHRQLWGRSELAIDSQFNRANYLTAPESTTFSGRAQLTIPSATGSTSLGFSRNESSVSTFGSVSQSLSIGNQRSFGSKTRTQLSLTWSDSQSRSNGTTISGSERVDLRFQGTHEFKPLTADFKYIRTVPVGGTDNFSGSSDQTPLLSLTSDAGRLWGQKTGRNWPFRFETTIGELQDFGTQGPITRMTFDTGIRRTELISKSTSLNWDGQFRQGIYSDDTAQYSLQYGSNLTQKFGRASLNLTYRNLRQFGFTPLAIDRTGRNDAFQFGAQFDMGQGWSADARTGYDLLSIERGQSPWQLVSIGSTYRGSNSRMQFNSTYDTFNQSWSSLRADGEWEMFGSRFGGGLRFDGLRSTWAAASLQAEALKMGKFTVDMLLSYNGYTKQFDAQQYAIAYDLHCWDAVLEITEFKSGFRGGRQVAFFFRLKALPFGSDFGYGRRGQRVGGVGGYGG